MKRFIRWPGLAAFVGIVAVCALIWYLAVDAVIHYTVEKTGTKAVGAKVELASADFSLFPLGLELTGLQVTNPKKPMRNAMVAKNIEMRFDTGYLLKGRKVVEHLSATGIAFDRERRSSGALPGRKAPDEKAVPVKEKAASQLKKLAAFSTQNAREMIKNEKLQTIEEARSLKQDTESARTRFQERMEKLPDEETFKDYEKRLEELRSSGSGGVLGAIGKVDKAKKLRDAIRSDLVALREARADFTQTRSRLQERVRALQNAPARDAGRLMDKYALTPAGIANMSALVFGPKYAGWVESGLTWYNRLSPYLARTGQAGEEKAKRKRGKGVDVIFDPQQAVPEYWIQTAQVALADEKDASAGAISGKIRNISSSQQILGRPLTFEFSGAGLRETGRIDINGRLDRTNPDKPEDTAKFNLGQYPLRGLSLLDRNTLELSMDSARIKTAKGTIRIIEKALDADIRASLEAARFQVAPGERQNFLTQALAGALEAVDAFNVNLELAGSLSQPDIKISSDMDDTLKNALAQSLEKRRAELKTQLRQAINEKSSGPVNEARSGFSGLDSIQQELQKRLNMGAALLPG